MAWLKGRFVLVDNWQRNFWHLWSIRLAALFAVIVAGVLGHMGELAALVANLDQPWRTLLSLAVALISFMAPAAARLTVQAPPKEATDADPQASI